MDSFHLGLSDESGQIKDAFSFLAPIIDPPKFGIWLLEEVQSTPIFFVSFSCSFHANKNVVFL